MRQLFVLFLILSLSGYAAGQSQATTGTIEGTVMDQSGAVLPNVEVKLKNAETGVTRSLVTDERGLFRAPLLPVGRYDASITFSGFAPFQQTGIPLTVGQTANLNIRMTVAGATEQVSVTAEAPLIESARTQVSSTVNDLAVANLPVNGRNFIDFVLLTPG